MLLNWVYFQHSHNATLCGDSHKYLIKITNAIIDIVDTGILKLCTVGYPLVYSFFSNHKIRFGPLYQLLSQNCHRLKVGWHKTHEGTAASIRVLLLHKCSMFSMTENLFYNLS